MKYLIHFLLTVPVFFAVDLIWLGWLGRPLYKKYIGHLLAENVNWTAAIIFYLLFIIGIMVFLFLGFDIITPLPPQPRESSLADKLHTTRRSNKHTSLTLA